MHLIDSQGAVEGKFIAGNPITNTAPTHYTAAWSNAVQEEIANVITADGTLLQKSKNDQLLVSINAAITRAIDALERKLRAEFANGGGGTVTPPPTPDPPAPLPAGTVSHDPSTGILSLNLAGDVAYADDLLTLTDTATETYLYTQPNLEITNA